MPNYKQLTKTPAVVLLTCITLLLAACAGAPRVEPQSAPQEEVVWPAPPEPAVIRYVGDIRNMELPKKEEKKRFRDILGGSEAEKPPRTLLRPYAVTTDDKGRIFVGDAELHSVVVYDADGKFLGEWGVSGKGNVVSPLGLDTDRAGNLYVSDSDGQRIVVFGPDGQYLNAFGGRDLLVKPVGLAINDELGRVYVADSRGNKISVFGLDGTPLFTITGAFGPGLGGLYFPITIDIDGRGNLWVVDSMNFRIVALDADGTYIRHWGGLGANLGKFTRPKGVALDSDGNVYVSDVAFDNIQIFNQEGSLLLFFGVTGSGPVGFAMPADLHFDENDRLYVADQHNGRVKILEYLGPPETPGNESN